MMSIESKKLDFIQSFLLLQDMETVLVLERILKEALMQECTDNGFEVETFVNEIEKRREISGQVSAHKIDQLFKDI